MWWGAWKWLSALSSVCTSVLQAADSSSTNREGLGWAPVCGLIGKNQGKIIPVHHLLLIQLNCWAQVIIKSKLPWWPLPVFSLDFVLGEFHEVTKVQTTFIVCFISLLNSGEQLTVCAHTCRLSHPFAFLLHYWCLTHTHTQNFMKFKLFLSPCFCHHHQGRLHYVGFYTRSSEVQQALAMLATVSH